LALQVIDNSHGLLRARNANDVFEIFSDSDYVADHSRTVDNVFKNELAMHVRA
jgi:hypothetical protein